MKKYFALTVVALSTLLFSTFTLAHSTALISKANTNSLATIVNKVTPAVVKITVERKLPADEYLAAVKQNQLPSTEHLMGLGSGIIFNAKKGLIITNAHVVNHAKIIIVSTKDGRRFRAKLIGQSNDYDIAIIKIQAKHLHPMVFANSNKLKVGDFVVAIGSPFGLTESVTSGVVSSLNRTAPKIEGFQSFIQTDAPINPGNSGGALVNLQGQLVGINTAIISPTDQNNGIGFAIPSNMVKSVAQQLIKYGTIKRGMLGMIIQNLTPDLAHAMQINDKKGALVSQVIPNSPAAQSGLKPEDVIIKLDGNKVKSNIQLRNSLGLKRPGTKIKLTVLRNHHKVTLHAIIGDPNKMLTPYLPFLTGMQLQNYSELAADSRYIQGVLVTNVSDTSDGALAGIIPGDIIIAANNKTTDSISELEKVALNTHTQLLLKVVRDNKNLFLVIDSDK